MGAMTLTLTVRLVISALRRSRLAVLRLGVGPVGGRRRVGCRRRLLGWALRVGSLLLRPVG